jgi:hypothetical protein
MLELTTRLFRHLTFRNFLRTMTKHGHDYASNTKGAGGGGERTWSHKAPFRTSATGKEVSKENGWLGRQVLTIREAGCFFNE